MFEFLGAAGAGAAEGLDDLLLQQLRRQQMEQQAREAEAQLAQRSREHADVMGLRNREFEAGEAARAEARERQGKQDREKGNQTGVRRMIGDFLMQRQGPLTSDDRRAVASMQVENGEVPDASLLSEPTPKRHPMTVRGPNGQPMRRLVDESELESGVEEYREPKEPRQGPAPDYEWVVGADGQPRQIRKGTAQRGDRPYDAVATRQDGAKPKGPSDYTLEHSRGVVRKVDDILPRISGMTAGPVGSILSRVGGTDASDVSADLESLAANIAFDQLSQMREASKTGGALGGVAIRELELLENAQASIRQNQSPANLKKNLALIRESANRFLAEADKSGGIDPMRPAPSHAPADPLGIRRPK